MKPNLLLIAIILFAIQQTIAQQQFNPNKQPQADWIKNGKDTLYTNKFIGIMTNSPDAELDVNGTITGKVGHFRDYLKVGDNSFYFVDNVGPAPFSDHIRSDLGRIAMMAGNATSFNSNILVGIGTTNA
jgi:hypothetical protein